MVGERKKPGAIPPNISDPPTAAQHGQNDSEAYSVSEIHRGKEYQSREKFYGVWHREFKRRGIQEPSDLIDTGTWEQEAYDEAFNSTDEAGSGPRAAGQGYAVGDTVELNNGAFIRIRHIYRLRRRAPLMLSGDLFERNLRLMGWLPRPENEVFWLWTYSPGQDPETARAPIVKARLNEVRQKWELLVFSPRGSQYHSSFGQAQNNHPSVGTLICNWVYTCASSRTTNRGGYDQTYLRPPDRDEKSLIAIGANQKYEDYDSSYKRRRHQQGSSAKSNPASQYTFGDAFAGCGGMSRGATMAELSVKWGFDQDKEAIKAYRTNFPEAHAWQQSANQFLESPTDSKSHVDVLHLSPPCQYFSRAHTVKGIHDRENIAALYRIPGIVAKTNARVVTVEQVPNIIVAHPAYFSDLIGFFTRVGHNYNIRWKVINCAGFGVAQKHRNRLFLIASRPGEDLPKFPDPTYAEIRDPQNPHLPLWNTVANAIDHVSPGCVEFNTLPLVNRATHPNWKEYDPNQPHRSVVKAHPGGSEMCHPSGSRNFTIHEVARLQSFPCEHRYSGSWTKKWSQIGNAVPPLVAKAILHEVRRSLMMTDSHN